MKRSGLIPLAEEISKHPSIDSVIWLLLFMLVKIYNETEQAEQGKIPNVKFEEKKSTRTF